MHSLNLGVLFVLGIGVTGGILGAWVFQRLRIPQVVGYIAIGLLIGQSGLRFVTAEDVKSFQLLNLFALGIIGFLVGGELKAAIFKQYGKQFAAILLGEGIAAFVLVGVTTGIIVYLVAGNFHAALASGIVLGAIASATDPASTIQVLWEYRARGVLTTALVAIVALDDALAMTLYGFGTSIAAMLTGGHASISAAAAQIGVEVFGSVLLGAAAGVILSFILKYLFQPERALALAIGTLLVVIAVAAAIDMDVILATMATGVTLINVAPRRSAEMFSVVRSFASPIYVIFFVLVGARLTVSGMAWWLWIIVVVYVVFRTIGKTAGTWFGARLSGADDSVRKYAGFGLFAQGGIAVGLSIMASTHLGDIYITKDLALGDMIIYTVTATTLVVQIIGPSLVKLSIRLAGEIGRDVTEEDVIEGMTVADVFSRGIVTVSENAPVAAVLRMFSDHDHSVFPVVDAAGDIVGLITLEGMKNLLSSQDSWQWLVAADVMMPVESVLAVSTPLQTAFDTLRSLGVDQIPVTADEVSRKPAGILDMRKARIALSEELLRRRQGSSAGTA